VYHQAWLSVSFSRSVSQPIWCISNLQYISFIPHSNNLSFVIYLRTYYALGLCWVRIRTHPCRNLQPVRETVCEYSVLRATSKTT
jgi:hypothetical protein